MTFPKYGKIRTLYRRDPDTFKVLEGAFTRPEYQLIPEWRVTEKIDGTNVRVLYDADMALNGLSGWLSFGCSNDRAQLQTTLLTHLQATFSLEGFAKAFPDIGSACVTLFGEGYGPGIQKVGPRYGANVCFRLFDVLMQPDADSRGIWLQPWDVKEVAGKLGIQEAPMLGRMALDDVARLVQRGLRSRVAYEDPEGDITLKMEGIVARAPYGVLDRQGKRIMWKLKARDL